MAIPRTSLPQEVLLTIFKLTEPPPHIHLPDIRKGPRNPWLNSIRTKKSLVLVCKLWAPPATEFLYSDIVLRRMGQISALANTFRTDKTDTLPTLVRSLRLDMCVVLSHCSHVVRGDLVHILNRCNMLLSFTCNPHPHPGFKFDSGPLTAQLPSKYAAFNPNWILNISRIGGPGGAGGLLARLLHSRLLTLSLNIPTDGDSMPLLAQILSSAPHLTTLNLGTVHLHSSGFRIDPWSNLPDLSFPELRSLSIHCDAVPFAQYVAKQWTMPRLASLDSKGDYPIPILAAHGRQLTYLRIYTDPSPVYLSPNASLLPRLHELCPRISHLAIRLAPGDRTALNLISPSLRFLDIIDFPSVAAYRSIALSPTARAPRLRKIRMVMTLPTCDFLPLHFHPTHLLGSDSALEDLSSIPGIEQSDDAADWLMLMTGGIEGACPEGLVRQHSWAVVVDERWRGASPPGAVWDSEIDTLADSDDETDSEGEYEYESRPTSPVSEDEDTDTDDSDGDGAEGRDGDCEGGVDARSEDGGGSDSDMERRWFEVEPEMPPYPNKVQFVDDPLDSSQGQYDRATVLERFSQSQLGDFLLE